MSQTRRPEIGSFFRNKPRQLVPQKRSTPEPHDDTATPLRADSSDGTPSTVRRLNQSIHRENSTRSIGSNLSPLVTPKSGRSVSIPIRSPSATTPSTFSRSSTALFDISNKKSKSSPDPEASFAFLDVSASTKKVIEDGKLIAVRDSDESDNESLESLTDILGRKPETAPTTKASKPLLSNSKLEDERLRLLSIYTGGRSVPIVNRDKIRALQRAQKENKFDMSSIIDEDLKDEESRKRIASIEAELEESTRELQQAKQSEMDRKMLAAILQGDAQEADLEELNRLMNAVDRTEALSGERSFVFFQPGGPRDLTKVKRSKKAFPSSAIPGKLWQTKDHATRDQMYLSGIMTELAFRGKLADDALRWTYESISYETDEELRDAYLQCVAASSVQWTRANITPEDIQDIFISLGADQMVVRDKSTVEAQRSLRLQKNKSNDYQSLLVTLTTFERLCTDMDFPSLSKLTSSVCRLCLDDHVMADNTVASSAESLLQKLMTMSDSSSRQHVHERIMSDIAVNIQDPTLQARFISRFTPLCPSAATLRINLAARFLLGEAATAQVEKPQSKKQIIKLLLSHVRKSPSFRIASTKDFQDLTANVFLLNVAICAGIPFSFESTTEDKAFNEQVDALADTIHDLFVSIADSGASHMRRTEAKDALQALHNRLLFAVRTKTRRKRHIFDAQAESLSNGRIKDAEEARQDRGARDFMQRFLVKRRDGSVREEGMKRSVETDVDVNVDAPS